MKNTWILIIALLLIVSFLPGCVSNVAPNSSSREKLINGNTSETPKTVIEGETNYSPDLKCENFNYQGYSAMVDGSYDSAFSFFDQALALNPDFVAALNNKGYVYYKKGDLKNALIFFERANQRDPDNRVSCVNKIQTAYEIGNKADMGSCSDFSSQRVFCYINIGDITGSLKSPVNPLDPKVWKERATGDYTTKCKVFFYRNYLELIPNDAISWNNYAVVLAASGQNDLAVVAIDRALSYDPENQTFLRNKEGIKQYGGQMSYMLGEILEVAPPIRFTKGAIPYFDTSKNASKDNLTN
jgi:tetratricopeptide (TPR) repeat protein